MTGICSYGGYVPRYRLNRGGIYMAMGWMNPANIANAKGEKAVANFDEDSITMAVAAGQKALNGMDLAKVNGAFMASTTMPYKERLNAGIVATALGLVASQARWKPPRPLMASTPPPVISSRVRSRTSFRAAFVPWER